MKRSDQLGLLLWKNYVVRKRRPGMLALVFLWPVLVFLILYAVRDNTDPEINPTCQFPARLMPGDDLLPFLQSFICTLGNPCDPLEEYEELPSYKNAKLGPLVRTLQPMLKNETILNVAKALPNSFKFLKAMTEILTRPGVKEIFDRGIHLGDLFSNHDKIRQFFDKEVPQINSTVVDYFFNASIKIQYLVKTFGSSNIDGIICTPSNLKEFLILPNEDQLVEVSKALCAMNSSSIPSLLEHVTSNLDFGGLLDMVNLVMAKFRDYDVFVDLKKTTETILSLETIDMYIPKKVQVRKWLPEMILLFKNTTFREIDLSYIQRAIDVLDPIFRDERDYPIVRQAMQKLNLVLRIIKEFRSKDPDPLVPGSVYRMTKDLIEDAKNIWNEPDGERKIGEIMDTSYEILRAGAQVAKILINDYQSLTEVSGEVLDGIKNFFPKKILNNLSYMTALADSIVQTVHHVATLHFETSRRIFDVVRNHTSQVQAILREGPEVYRALVTSFSHMNFVEDFLAVNKKTGEVICDRGMFHRIFPPDKVDLKVEDLFSRVCNEEGRQMMTEISDSFNLSNFESIVRNTLATFVFMVLGAPAPMEIANLTSVLQNTKRFVNYLETRESLEEPNWGEITSDREWIETFKNFSALGRLDVLGVHLSIAKNEGSISLSYGRIKPALSEMDTIAKRVIERLDSHPIEWINEANEDLPQLIDSFFLTSADRSKVLDLLETENFANAVCDASESKRLLNFPNDSNITRLRNSICHVSRITEDELKFDTFEYSKTVDEVDSFDWTNFNERVVKIYSYVDNTVHTVHPEHNFTRSEIFKQSFITSWTDQLNTRDAIEVSVGLLCKLFGIIDMPLFGLRPPHAIEAILYEWPRAAEQIFDGLQNRVNIVQGTHVTEIVLTSMPRTEIFEEVVLRNFNDLVNDAKELVTSKMSNIASVVDYMRTEESWPCKVTRSLGDALSLREGTKEIVKEIERIACTPGPFVDEWTGLLTVIPTEDRQKSFNWTKGYGKFRRLVGNLSNLTENIVLSTSNGISKLSTDDAKSIFASVKKLMENNFTDVNAWRDILTRVDEKLNDFINFDNSSLTTYDVWQSRGEWNTRMEFVAISKFFAHAVHELSTIIVNILDKAPEIDAFAMLGFGKRSPIVVAYDNLAGLTSTIANGLTSSKVLGKIKKYAAESTRGIDTGRVSCSEVFSWFEEFLDGISPADYRALENFTCDSDPEHFNDLTDFILAEDAVRKLPVKTYPLYATRALLKIYELSQAVNNTMKMSSKVKYPFSSEYSTAYVKNFTHFLRNHRSPRKFLNPSDYELDLTVEGLSEILKHVAGSLKKMASEKKSGNLRLWELVEDGDARQFLKFVENEPIEMICFVASLFWVNPNTNAMLPSSEYHEEICHRGFGLDFWRNNEKRKHFLQQICTFDHVQLLKSITSEQFFNRLQRRTGVKDVHVEYSVPEAILEVVEAAQDLKRLNPGMKFQSNLLNAKTLSRMDQESWAIVYRAEESWLHSYYKAGEIHETDQKWMQESYVERMLLTDTLRSVDLVVQQASMLVDFVSGGDIWMKIRRLYDKNPSMRTALIFVEDLPNFLITALDSYVKSNVTASSVGGLVARHIEPCEVSLYLREPTFIRREGFLGSFAHLCDQLENIDLRDVLPFENIIVRNSSLGNEFTVNESVVMDHVKNLQKLLIDTLGDGTKDFRIPSYWTAFLAGTFKDFVTEYDSMDPGELLNIVLDRLAESVQSILERTTYFRDCEACEHFTKRLRVINSQFSKHQIYKEFICSLGELNITEIHDMMYNKMQWSNTIDEIKLIQSGEFVHIKPDHLVTEVRTFLRSLGEIALPYIRSNHNRTVNYCNHSSDQSLSSNPKTYVNIINSILDVLQGNLALIRTDSTRDKLEELAMKAEKYVPIWSPVEYVVNQSDLEDTKKYFLNVDINVNMLVPDVIGNKTALYEILTSKHPEKFLKYPRFVEPHNPEMVANYLFENLDREMILRRMPGWNQDAVRNMMWLKEILFHVEMFIEEVGNLAQAVSNVDLDAARSISPKLMETILDLLRKETIDKFFNSFDEILNDVDPFIDSPIVKKDLHTILRTFESMEIFKNLGLLNTKYAVKEMFSKWENTDSYLREKIGLPESVTMALSQGKVNMLSVLTRESQALTMQDNICSADKLSEILDLGSGLSIQDVTSTLCALTSDQIQNIAVTLIKNVNFGHLIEDIMSANIKNILANANLNEKEGEEIFNNLGQAAKLVPLFKDAVGNVSDAFTSEALTKKENEVEEKTNFGEFLADAGQMMCGRKMVQDTGRFYKVISSIEDNQNELDDEELASLPAGFCRDTYKQISQIAGGKIIWTYVKPLLRGRILYTPNTTIISEVMKEANGTFVDLGNLKAFINSLEKSIVSIASLTELGDSLNDLMHILSSDIMSIAVKSMSGASIDLEANGALGGFDIGKIAWKMKNSKKLLEVVGMLNQLMDCLLTDRVTGFSDEKELEEEAGRLIGTNDFLAGVVFMDGERTTRAKRDYERTLPDNITYKIRMDVDSVPSTSRLKNQFWTPGPDGSFVENLRYFRGFVQLQDSIDRALIKIKTGTEQQWKTVSQQMPYPCWKFLLFQSSLYESQGLQVCFFFALMMCVGAAVRHIVWERESQNSMVMSVMGLKPWRNTFVWFITSLIELTIVAVSIHIVLTAGQILPHADPILLLILLLDYVLASVAFCYMISTMFSSASLAAVTSVVMFLLTYMPYIIVIAMEANMNLFWKLIICLNMSTSFCYGCLYAVRREVQGTGLTWSNLWDESSPGDSMSLGLVLLMMLLDACIYVSIGYLVTWYTNSGRGFHGLRSASLWWSEGTKNKTLSGEPNFISFENQMYFTNDVVEPSSTTHEEAANDSSIVPINKEKDAGVRFENVSKTYQTERGERVAVDDFSLQLREGEVTTLLGRNGAGKTTIIKMLTGMVAPTRGEIYLGTNDTDKPSIGVCPQSNVLVGCLTPREHMKFYARLKTGKSDHEVDKDIEAMLSSVELNGQENELVSRLSGGTQRRLCVSLAFLGSPKLVILDEPGAGVDPAARRRIWRLIDKHREGKTVLMSTHHLEEADMLSDTVVVMHNGRILCTGSPLSLKMTHGQGYKLTITYPTRDSRDNNQEQKLTALSSIVRGVVPNSTFDEANGQEYNVLLPFQAADGLPNDFAGVFKALEDNQETLGFSHFTTECDTLERVFLDLCSRVDHGHAYKNPGSQESIASTIGAGFTSSQDAIELIGHDGLKRPSAVRQCKALLKKRLWHFTRDWRAPLAALILPTLFVAVAMGFSLIRPPSDDQRPLALSPDLYDTYPLHFYSIDEKPDYFLRRVSMQLHDRFGEHDAGAWQTSPNDTGTCDCVNGEQVCHGLPPLVRGLFQTVSGKPTLDWIVSTHKQYIEKRYGGWSLSQTAARDNEDVFVVWYNNKGHHALPAYVNALNEAILRAHGVHAHLTTVNHPIKLSRDQLNRTSLLQHVADVGVALVLLVAFSLVGAQGARELVRERLSEEKRILLLAGVGPVTYWTAALIWDLLVFACSILLAIIVFEVFGLPAYVARDNLASVCILLFLYAWAIIPFTHLAEKIFDDSSLSNMVLFCLNTFIGVATLATILIIDVLGKTKAAEDTRKTLHDLFLLLPQYALADGLIQLSKNDIAASLLSRFHMDTYQHPLSREVFGPHCLYLLGVGAILYGSNLLVESIELPDMFRRKVTYSEFDGREDEDVAVERQRVEDEFDNDVVRMIKVRKEYRTTGGKNVAVRNLSLGIRRGECFGLFGVNGAGKSTTFKMLTKEIRQSAGRVVVNGRDLPTGPLCSGEVGYCPQTDAVDPFLTPRQSLTIHAEISGMNNVPRLVRSSLERFDLMKYADQRIDGLSGGNKRKLCTAVSTLAPTRIVLMDEATSGMDPTAKHLVARAVRSIVKNEGSVLMTSHSVAECEDLCTRVGVLARAGLRCIGTPQHLKHKYGEAYIVFLRFSKAVSLQELQTAIARHLPDAGIASVQAMAARLVVPRRGNGLLSSIFAKIKDLATELRSTDYSLTQSSLDQVLVNLSEELGIEGFAGGGNRNATVNASNSYSTSDGIRLSTLSGGRFTALPIG